MLPSVYVPVAVNICAVPSGMDGFTGLIVMVATAAAVTVSVSDPVIPPSFASIFEFPVPTAEASPVLLIVVTDVFEEDHITLDVMSLHAAITVGSRSGELSSIAPLGMDESAAVTSIEVKVSVPLVTVSTSIGDVTPAQTRRDVARPDSHLVAAPPAAPVVIVAVVVVAEAPRHRCL